ncbi:histidine kinase [Streptomyces sp. NPDC001922]|uniref:sensor histidine kinase n=1 Tax=Streptomyces sp. NPDC001922 TaxID=3364624 RepID=UPI0036879A9B
MSRGENVTHGSLTGGPAGTPRPGPPGHAEHHYGAGHAYGPERRPPRSGYGYGYGPEHPAPSGQPHRPESPPPSGQPHSPERPPPSGHPYSPEWSRDPDCSGQPSLGIQVSALQALCRQVLGFRMAMIGLAAPAALARTAPGLPSCLVGGAVVVTFMGSYVLFRDWERFGPLLLRHPALLAVDMVFGSLLLITATPESTLAYVTSCTPLLAGLVYGWRGAGVFAGLDVLLLATLYAADGRLDATGPNAYLLAGFGVVAGAIGVTLRGLMFRVGAATRALTEARARLAVTEAVGAERARLAREMHDSVAKTLHGLALAADGLAGSAGRMDPDEVGRQAGTVARAARRAAAESRELLSDLRRETDIDSAGTDLPGELAVRVADFAGRTGLDARVRPLNETPVPPVPYAVARQLLVIVGEALDNAARHARPAHVVVEAGVVDRMLCVRVLDDGRGLPPGTTLDGLRKGGHFGLVGMVERAAGLGARLRIGRGGAGSGTEVRLDLPMAAVLPAGHRPGAQPPPAVRHPRTAQPRGPQPTAPQYAGPHLSGPQPGPQPPGPQPPGPQQPATEPRELSHPAQTRPRPSRGGRTP